MLLVYLGVVEPVSRASNPNKALDLADLEPDDLIAPRVAPLLHRQTFNQGLT